MSKCGGCPQPVWPSNTSNELLHGMQVLFSRDNHNHDQVLNERTYNLPLNIPQNHQQPGFSYCNAGNGQVNVAPYSSDNIMHVDWVPTRLATNVNMPWGSDADIYFDKVQAPPRYTAWKDWLDVNAAKGAAGSNKSIDEKVAECASANKTTSGVVCHQTCVDWWTNRPVPPQGNLTPQDGSIGGGCPWGTTVGLSCYPGAVHNLYVKNK